MKSSKLLQVLLGGLAVIGAGAASAAGLVDYSTVATSATSEIGSAISGAMPIVGPVLGATVGYALFRRFVR